MGELEENPSLSWERRLFASAMHFLNDVVLWLKTKVTVTKINSSADHPKTLWNQKIAK